MPLKAPTLDGGAPRPSGEIPPGTSGREHSERSVLVCRLGHAPWQWWEDETQQRIYHNLLTCLDEVLNERGHGSTVEKLGGNLRNHDVIVAATDNGKTDDDGNSGADVLVAVALDFLVAARRFQIPDETFPQLHMGIAHGDLLHGVYNLHGWRRGRGGTGIPPYLIAGRGVAEAKVLASASDGHALRVSETVMNMLRPDHAARLCKATAVKVNGSEDIVSYRLRTDEELLDKEAEGPTATTGEAVDATVPQHQQDWLLRFKNPALEQQFWLWWKRSNPAIYDMTIQWLMIFLSMMVTTVQMKHNVPVPGATGGGLPPKLAGLLPILHDFSVTVVIMLIGIAPDVYNRYRQPIAFIFRFVRTMYIILLQKFPVQGTVGLALLTHRFPTRSIGSWGTLFLRLIIVGPAIFVAFPELRLISWHIVGDALPFLVVWMDLAKYCTLISTVVFCQSTFILFQVCVCTIAPSVYLWYSEKTLRSAFLQSYSSKVKDC